MLKTIQEIQKLKNIGCRLVLQKRLADIIMSTKRAAPMSCSVKKATPIAAFLSGKSKHETLGSIDILRSDLLVISNAHYRRATRRVRLRGEEKESAAARRTDEINER